ncbi:MAG: adenylate kinase [Planctomycetota bacterium]
MKLVFLGPPGAGKGTQAARMSDEFGLEHASTGDIFRSAVAEGSELGETVQSYLDEGKLVPDELTSRVVDEVVLARKEDYILDGFPRTIGQAEMLEQMLQKRSQSLDGVIYFELEEDEAIRRLTGRLVCSECGANYHREFMPPKAEGICDKCGAELRVRSDSSETVVRDRLEEYEAKTAPLVPFYEEKRILKTVDASASPDEVSELTKRAIKDLQR